MNSKKRKLFVVAVTAATSFGPLADLASAQTTAAPKPAPSFIQQAGKALYENAQKNVIRKMSDQIKQQQAAPQATPAVAPGTAGASITVVPTPVHTSPPPMRYWMPKNLRPGEKPPLAILCIHGLGLQSNSYEFLGNELANKYGYAVYAMDVRGFGAWMTAKGKAQVNFDDCLSDIKMSLEAIQAANPGMPVYVLGESMGGAIALRAASIYPDLVDGLISSVPAGERFEQGKTSIKVFLNMLSGANLADIGGDVLRQATQNQKLASKWSGDPLARLNLSPQELIQFQDFMNNNHAAAAKVVDMPVLFVQGNGDQLVKPEGTWQLFNAVASKDKSFFAVPGEHLIFEEAQTQEAGARDQNFRVISSWLTAKVGGRTRGGRGRLAGYPGAGAAGGVRSGAYGFGLDGGTPNDGLGNGGIGSGGISSGGIGSGGISSGGFRTAYTPVSFINTKGLEPQIQLLANGQSAQAIAQLEDVLAQRPNDPNVMALLGKAYLQNGDADKAGFLYRSAMKKAARLGGPDAQALNNFLLTESQSWGGRLGPAPGMPGGAYGGKGKVYAFYANWADQCRGMNDSLNQLSSMYGNSVDITRVNIADPASDALVEQFKVAPIPTVVFVAPSGQVTSTIIGLSSTASYEQAIKGIR
jgi:acylglycerol lipase